MEVGKMEASAAILPNFAGRPRSAIRHGVLEEVRRRVLTKEISKRAACETYGLGWHTLKKILAHDEPPGYRQSQPREKRKLAPFLPIIQQILKDDRQAPKKQRHTAKRIFERLRDEHRYQGGKTVVKDAVRDWKQSHQEVFLPLSHPPGEAQVDFGEATRECLITSIRRL